MKKIFQDFFLRLRYRKQLKVLAKRKIKHTVAIKTVGILTDSSMIVDRDFIQNIANQLGISVSKIQLMTSASLKENEFSNKSNIIFYNQNELSWTAQLTEQQNKFCDTPFDVLINYFVLPGKLLSALSVCSRAKFRVGFVQTDARLNDLIFDFKPSQKDIFFDEFSKYIKTIFKIA
jgi:hypothetical protein